PMRISTTSATSVISNLGMSEDFMSVHYSAGETHEIERKQFSFRAISPVALVAFFALAVLPASVPLAAQAPAHSSDLDQKIRSSMVVVRVQKQIAGAGMEGLRRVLLN